MTVHLHDELWYDEQKTGKLRMKRVSAAAEAHFPRRYRVIYQKGAALAIVKAIREEKQCSLSEAWSEVKRMFNGFHATATKKAN